LNLPRYDGIEILEAMRANRAFADVPVAVLSSSSSPRDRARIEAFHIGRYITKPPNLDEYMRIGLIVKQLLEEAKSRT
jgi:CheY-like chemotaxis protein